ncbi:hypothetical protein GALMADRAFT_737484 [Galerina marginata CBS 339.88]|uniref:Protein kish n=1 Tax=Galerina marginata (strain CBS 339.88) TaxID=685588 RepID=A0A067SPN7_GALM3|nr:hypothetical protein GALMADRAFT_737484 [Galerina marginata CBS 339.88]
MSALFNFQSLLLVILLFICTCTYVRAVAPGLVDRNKVGFPGLLFKSARIGSSTRFSSQKKKLIYLRSSGERLSPYVGLACIAMAVTMLLK